MSTKIIFDRSFALLSLILVLPLLPVISLIVFFSVRGESVIFTQERVGRHGKLFTIYKFRTIRRGLDGKEVISPIARLLRKYKLDELPELWNVVKGNMSFVGPRPDISGYADQLQGEERIILELLPSITGPATMKYRAEEELLADIGKQSIFTVLRVN